MGRIVRKIKELKKVKRSHEPDKKPKDFLKSERSMMLIAGLIINVLGLALVPYSMVNGIIVLGTGTMCVYGGLSGKKIFKN